MSKEVTSAKDTIRLGRNWVPLLLGCALAFLAVVLWQMLLAGERAHLQETVAAQAQHVAELLKESLEGRIPALKRMAKRWEVRGGIPRSEWEADAKNFFQDNPDIQALEWVDPSFHVRWIVPTEGNTAVLGIQSGFDQKRQQALETAKTRRTVTITRPINLVQGGKGFLTYVPLFVEDDFQGFILAVFRFQHWLDSLLIDVNTSQYSYQLFDNGEEIYIHPNAKARCEAEAAQEAQVSVQGLTWRVRSCPTPELIAQSTTWLPEVSLAVGWFFAILIGFTVRLAQSAASRATSIKKVNETLEKEIAERRHMEDSLRLTQLTLDCAGDSVFLIGQDARFLYVNEAACEGLGYTRDELLRMAVYDIDPDWDPIVWPDFWEKLIKQKVVHLMSRHQRKDGSIFPVEITTNYLKFEGKEYDCAVVRDVTERISKKIYQQLSEQSDLLERQNESFVQALGEIVYEHDVPRDFIKWGGAYSTLLGYEEEEFRNNGASWLGNVHPDDYQAVEREFERAKNENHIYDLEYRIRRCDWTYLWMHDRGVMHFDQEGNLQQVIGILLNITQRRQAEAALRESEAWFKTISEAIPHQVWTANPDGALDYVNPQVLEYYERSFDQMIGWNWTEGLHPDDFPVCLERWAQAREQGIPYEIEFRLQRPSDQSYRWFLGKALPLKNQEGRIIKWFGTSTDITDRKQAEEVLRQAHDDLEERVTARTAELVSVNANLAAEILERKSVEVLLRESEGRLNSILEHSPSLIFIKDLKGCYLHTNSQFDKVFHFEKYQALGKTDEELFPPKQAAKFRKNDQQVIHRQAPLIFEEVAEQEDGTHTSIVSKFPLFDTKGQIYGVCGITLDITERTRMERALRESEERYELAARATFNAIWDWDFATNLVKWNEGIQSLFGYAPDAIGPDAIWWKENIHPEDRDTVVRGIHAIIDSDQSNWLDEYRFRCTDGTYALVVHRGYVVRDETGKAIRMVGAMDDITDQKRLEKDILTLNASLEERVQQRTAELEVKNAELEHFTYAVSHDLKSPLVTIQGFLKILGEDAHAGRTTRLDEDIQRIDGAAQKMQQLLNELLDLSQVGRIVSSPEPVAMEGVVHEAVEQVAGQTSALGIHVSIAPEWPVVIGDRPRLVEVVQNLVDNATKFMGKQPEPRIEIGVRQNGEDTVMFVRDNGIGIEQKFQKKIFGLFERLDARAEGTGIGLALVKRIIEVQGGRIWVESEGQGHGCTFCFTLPCKRIRASTSQESPLSISEV